MGISPHSGSRDRSDPDVAIKAYMIELRHLGVRRFVIEEFRHLATGCTAKWGPIGLMLFRYLSYVWGGAIIWDVNTIGFVSVYACRVCEALVSSCATVH